MVRLTYPETRSVISEQDGCFGFRGLEGYFIQIWEDEKLIAETSWLDRQRRKNKRSLRHGFGGSIPFAIGLLYRHLLFDPIQSIKKNFFEN